MATRTTLKSTTPGAITGDAYMDNVAAHVTAFWNAANLPLTGIAGTANDVTAVVDPALDAGLAAGMGFSFTPAAGNTGAMTMKIGAETAVDLVAADGSALAAGAVLTTTLYQLLFDGTRLRIVSTPGADQTGAVLVYDVHTSSGTSVKPAGFPDDGLLVIEAWGGGGGGNNNGGGVFGAGGGGGAYNMKVYRGFDHGPTETVTIGAGGAIGANGGNTSIGALCDAFGGAINLGARGGGGGGQQSAGFQSAGGRPFGAAASTGASANAGGGASGNLIPGGDGIFGGGGGGGGGGGSVKGPGGASLYGGGGGGGADTNGAAAGGVSSHGGNGGAGGVGGSIPAGGGGGNAAGARGEIRVRWIG
jgi:hypothetical protein